MTSGGIGKKELSTKETMPKKNFELLWEANFKHFKYRELNIFWF